MFKLCIDVYLNARLMGRSKLTVIQCPFRLRPFGRPCTVDLDASKYTTVCRPFERNCPNGFLDNVYLYHPNTRTWTTLEHIIG